MAITDEIDQEEITIAYLLVSPKSAHIKSAFTGGHCGSETYFIQIWGTHLESRIALFQLFVYSTKQQRHMLHGDNLFVSDCIYSAITLIT